MKPLIFPWAPEAIAMLTRGTPVCALRPGPRLARVLEVASALGVLPGHVLAIADHIDFSFTGEVIVYATPVAKAPRAEDQTANDQPSEPEPELKPVPHHPDRPTDSGGRPRKSPGPTAGKPDRQRKGKSSRQ